MLGVKSITFKDIINSHILPAFQSDQACQLPPRLLVSYMAFISLSGLLNTSKADARAPDTADGRKLLKQLQQCAVFHQSGPCESSQRCSYTLSCVLRQSGGFKLVSGGVHLCLLPCCAESNLTAIVLLQCSAQNCLVVSMLVKPHIKADALHPNLSYHTGCEMVKCKCCGDVWNSPDTCACSFCIYSGIVIDRLQRKTLHASSITPPPAFMLHPLTPSAP